MLNAVHVMISAEMLALCLCLYLWMNINAYQVFLKRLIRTFDYFRPTHDATKEFTRITVKVGSNSEAKAHNQPLFNKSPILLYSELSLTYLVDTCRQTSRTRVCRFQD
jgi:hypothetical protein